jgi:hypothetical protein
MALTRITKGVIKPNENYDTHNINSTGIVTAVGGNFTGDLTVGGVLTYEDVTSIDSVGIITAQKDIHVGAGVSAVGVGTFGGLDISGDIDVDGHTNLDNVSVAGVVTFSNSPNGIQMNDGARVSFGNSLKTSISYVSSDSRTKIRNYNDTLEIGYRNTEIHHSNVARLTFDSGNTFTNAVNTSFTGANYHAVWIPSSNLFRLNDNAKLAFGSQTDATIHHNNSNLLISNTNGNIDVTGTVVLNNDISVDGHTNLDNVSISGVTTITSTAPELHLTDTNADSDYSLVVNGGSFRLRDETNGVNRLTLNSSGVLHAMTPTVVLGESTFGSSSITKVYSGLGSTKKNALMVLNPSASVTGRGAGVAVGAMGAGDDYIGTLYAQRSATGDNRGTTTLEGKDAIVIKTNAANSTVTAATFDTSGRLGIGTISPTALIHLHKASGDAIQKIESSNGAGVLELRHTNGYGYINYRQDGAETFRVGQIAQFTSYSVYNPNNSLPYQLCVEGNGEVGINTHNPSNTLHLLRNSTNHGITLQRGGTNAGSASINVTSFGALDLTASNNFNITSGGSQQIIFNRGGTEVARFDTSGNIGIGTNNPTQSLQGNWNKVLAISAGTSNGSMIRFIESSSASGGNNKGLLVGQHNNNSYIVNYQTGFMSLRTNNAERMVITSTGEVNIGGDYTQTAKKFKVTGNSTFDGGIYFTGTLEGSGFSVNGGNVIMPAKIAHDGDSDTNFGFPTTDTFQVETAGTERLRINSSGQVLIGTNSSPDCKLHITNGTLKIETQTTFYSGSGENGENYPSIFLNADHSSGNNPAHGKITVRHSNQNTYSGDLVFMPQGYYSGSYGYEEVMRVSAYKRVGINVTPSSALHVVNNTSDTIAQFGQSSEGRYARFVNIPNQQNFDHLLLRRYDNSTVDVLRLQNTYASGTGWGTGIGWYGHGGNVTGRIKVVNATTNSSVARMHLEVNNQSIIHMDHAPNRAFIGQPSSAGGFEDQAPLQVRSSQGNTGCFSGTTTNYNTLFGLLPWAGGGTYLSSGITYNNGSWIHKSSDTTNCLLYMRGNGFYWYSSSNSSGSWNVFSGGQVMNSVGQWTGGTSSDRRLKDNITNMSTSDALTKVTQLQGVSYTWKDEIRKKYGTGAYPEGTHYGFIAQDVKTVWPEAHIISDVDNESDFDDDPTKDVKDDVYYGEIEGVKMEKMVPLLVEAIKELKRENDDLKARVTTLESS